MAIGVASGGLLALGGCGTYFDVAITNRTEEVLRVDLVDRWYGGSESEWLSATVDAGGMFDYAMKDGWRSQGKYVRLSRTAAREGVPLVVIIQPGELLWPRTTNFSVELDNGTLVRR